MKTCLETLTISKLIDFHRAPLIWTLNLVLLSSPIGNQCTAIDLQQNGLVHFTSHREQWVCHRDPAKSTLSLCCSRALLKLLRDQRVPLNLNGTRAHEFTETKSHT